MEEIGTSLTLLSGDAESGCEQNTCGIVLLRLDDNLTQILDKFSKNSNTPLRLYLEQGYNYIGYYYEESITGNVCSIIANINSGVIFHVNNALSAYSATPNVSVHRYNGDTRKFSSICEWIRLSTGKSSLEKYIELLRSAYSGIHNLSVLAKIKDLITSVSEGSLEVLEPYFTEIEPIPSTDTHESIIDIHSELVSLAAAFVELFSKEQEFSRYILNLIHLPENDINKLLQCEREMVIKLIQLGIENPITDYIAELNFLRRQLSLPGLPKLRHKESQENATRSSSAISIDNHPLLEMRHILKRTMKSISHSCEPKINITRLVNCYNRCTETYGVGRKLRISCPDSVQCPGTFVIDGNTKNRVIVIPPKQDDDELLLSMYETDLRHYTDEELERILIYLDELYKDGDRRYALLQKNIIDELSTRDVTEESYSLIS